MRAYVVCLLAVLAFFEGLNLGYRLGHKPYRVKTDTVEVECKTLDEARQLIAAQDAFFVRR